MELSLAAAEALFDENLEKISEGSVEEFSEGVSAGTTKNSKRIFRRNT